jgi:hypothetical protein
MPFFMLSKISDMVLSLRQGIFHHLGHETYCLQTFSSSYTIALCMTLLNGWKIEVDGFLSLLSTFEL